MTDSLLPVLAGIAEMEFADVTTGYEITQGKLRIYIVDGTFLDVWFSKHLRGRYAYHWERRRVNNTIYRWDNAKHEVWKNVRTFPHHFHNRTDDDVRESFLPSDPDAAIRFVLGFVRDVIYRDRWGEGVE